MFWFVAENRLTVQERELFLAEPHIAALSVSAGPGRGPLTVPIWYQYEPGGEVWILTEARSRKAARDPGADHDHALDRPGYPAGNVRPPVIEALSRQCHHLAQANAYRARYCPAW